MPHHALQVHTHQLAVGLDKSRRDFGVLIWDINRGEAPLDGGASGAVGRATAPPAVLPGASSQRLCADFPADFSSCTSFDISAAGMTGHSYRRLPRRHRAMQLYGPASQSCCRSLIHKL